MKRCIKCGAEKPLTDFYMKNKATNRFDSKCKPCHMDDVRDYRAEHPEYFRMIDRRRGMMPHRVAARAKWATEHPDRFKARKIVQNAIRRGRLVRLPCVVCGKKAQGHHPDYSRPLEVVWLCPTHHQQTHAQMKRAA